MGKVRVLLLSIVLFCAFFSSESNANSAACILLKQQMSNYQHSKTHPTYRRAQRDYERLCNQPEVVEDKATESAKTQQTSLSEEEKRLAQERFEAIEAKQQEQQTFETKEDARGELTDNEDATNSNEQQVVELDSKTQTEAKETPKAQPAAPVKRAPVTWQNDIPVEESSLLEAMMLPIILLLVVLVAIFVYVKFVRSRMDEIKEKAKEKAQEMSKDIAAMGSKVAEKKKNKLPKGALDPDLYFRRQRVEVTLANGQEVVLDSVIASQYGIFVVLPQKQRGAIIGSATLPEWKEQVGDELIGFESPLQVVNQCCHAVAQILGLNDEIEPIVAFNDMAVFKSQFPIVVMHKKQVNPYILGFKELRFSDQQVDEWMALIDSHNEAKREEKKRAEERQREENMNRHNEPKFDTTAPSPAEVAEQEVQEKQQETVYPEPGSYENSVSEIAPDNQDVHRVEDADKPAVDHIAELDSILNKAKQFTEKLDDISSATPATSDDETQPPTLSAQDVEPLDYEAEQPCAPSTSDESILESEANDLSNDFRPDTNAEFEKTTQSLSSDESFDMPFNEASTQQASASGLDNGDSTRNTFDNELIDDSATLTQSNELQDELGQPEAQSQDDDSLLPPDSSEPATAYTDPDYFKSADDDAPENMVPHSEFKRRAAKRAVDDGMFDYLNHYDKSAENDEQSDGEYSLEEELAQSLAAGKGFLSGLEQKDDALDEEPKLPARDDADMLAQVETKLDQEMANLSADNDLLEQPDTSLQQDLNDFDINSLEQDLVDNQSTISDSVESSENDSSDLNQGGWRAIKAQMDEQSNDQILPPSVESEPQDEQPKSSWRALKEQVNDEIDDELNKTDQDSEADKNDSEKSSPFSNLQLDPDWAPKPPPEKVFKTKPEDDPDNN